MPIDDSAQWQAFYAITPEQIAQAIAGAEADFSGFMQREKRNSERNSTPEERARGDHEFLVMASAYSRMEHVVFESRVHTAFTTANRIAEHAQFLAFDKDRLKEIHEAAQAIERREGLPEGEDWLVGEGPEDHQALMRESDAIHERIAETIIPALLRRYQMEPLADLFEQDRRRFAILSEVGLRIMRPKGHPAKIVSKWDKHFAQRHGDEAMREVQRRTGEILRQEGRA